MTASPADRQRLKRQRRAARGIVKVEAWVDGDQMYLVDCFRQLNGMTRSEIIAAALKAYIA